MYMKHFGNEVGRDLIKKVANREGEENCSKN